jgi:hypothetical protein
MAMSPQALNSRQAFWEKHVSAWLSSGLSQADYCRKAKLHSWSLSYWHNKWKSGRPDPLSPASTETTSARENQLASIRHPASPCEAEECEAISRTLAPAIPSTTKRPGRRDPGAWRQHLSAWKKGGLPIAEYCRRNRLPRRAFHKWKKVFGMTVDRKAVPSTPAISASKATEAKFVSIPCDLLSSAVGGADLHRHSQARRSSERASSMTVCIGHRFRVIVRPDFSQAHLVKVIRTLEEIR